MNPLAAAHRYMDIFYSGSVEKISELESILSPTLVFKGPFREFRSSKEYIDALLADPPTDVTFSIVESVASGSAACLIYNFEKRGINTTMAQYFEVRNGLIVRIILVFDRSAFIDVEGGKSAP